VPKPTVLISGAGIAGPALAFWLTRSGFRVVVVELADGIRPSAAMATSARAVADSKSVATIHISEV
jgi:2-polyprenyl-6-methoxyphenol hydroxylase-like FAD-dependent oxidoreductase